MKAFFDSLLAKYYENDYNYNLTIDDLSKIISYLDKMDLDIKKELVDFINRFESKNSTIDDLLEYFNKDKIMINAIIGMISCKLNIALIKQTM